MLPDEYLESAAAYRWSAGFAEFGDTVPFTIRHGRDASGRGTTAELPKRRIREPRPRSLL